MCWGSVRTRSSGWLQKERFERRAGVARDHVVGTDDCRRAPAAAAQYPRHPDERTRCVDRQAECRRHQIGQVVATGITSQECESSTSSVRRSERFVAEPTTIGIGERDSPRTRRRHWNRFAARSDSRQRLSPSRAAVFASAESEFQGLWGNTCRTRRLTSFAKRGPDLARP